MSSYTVDQDRAMPDAGPAAHTPVTTVPDPRLDAFADFLKAVDKQSWPLGQAATRRLRQLGVSVCLCRPSGERGTT